MMLFGFTNKLFTFQNFMNNTLIKFLNKFVVTYLNDILIYNKNIKEHKTHVQKIFQKLKEADIQTNVNKCEFYKIKTKFLRILIGKDGI